MTSKYLDIEQPVQSNKKFRATDFWGLAYLFLIILCANEFLNLGAWTHISGKFNVRDIGSALIILGLVRMIMLHRRDPALWTPMSVLILLCLVMVTFHVGIASLYYGQSLMDGILSARHYTYYLSFFVFLNVLNTPLAITRFLNALTLMAIAIFALGIINYMGFTIFAQKWAEGHGERGGVTRGFLPAMTIISIAAVWEFSKYAQSGGLKSGGLASVILFGAHIFRQTRMRTIGLLAVLLFLLFRRRKWKAIYGVVLAGVIGVSVLEVMLDVQIITSQVTSAAENIAEGEGTWGARVSQLESAYDAFMAHPIIGSGSAVLRAEEAVSIGNSYRDLYVLQYKADLGYASWLKAFGMVGLVWLFSFFYIWWKMARQSIEFYGKYYEEITAFGLSSGFWIAGTFITLNHLMYVDSVVIVCACAAIVVRMYSFIGEYQRGNWTVGSSADT